MPPFGDGCSPMSSDHAFPLAEPVAREKMKVRAQDGDASRFHEMWCSDMQSC